MESKLVFHEHESRKLNDLRDYLLQSHSKMGIDKRQLLKNLIYLGLEYNYKTDEFISSYYVGIDWVNREDNTQIMILPKEKNLDFQTMFMTCFQSHLTNVDLEEIFYIRVGDKPIQVPQNTFELTPLLIVYFLGLVKNLVLNGLRRDYVLREENLKSTIKGKVLLSKYVKYDYALNRKDKVYCRYQEYDIDSLDNRILKKALLVVNDYLIRNNKVMVTHCAELRKIYDFCMPAFLNVSSEVSNQELQAYKVNLMYRNYKQALHVAKLIILHRDHCLEYTKKGNSEQFFPPFIINMSLLFERYIYALLARRYKSTIGYHSITTYGNELDFSKVDEHLIIDAKYIFDWGANKTGSKHENVRQLSGYARNHSIRKKLNIREADLHSLICPCLIIYPDKNGKNIQELGDRLYDEGTEVADYLRFRYMAVRLPYLNDNS